MVSHITNLTEFLSDSKNWCISYLLVSQLDLFMTLAGTHAFGISAEYNTLIRNALNNADYKVFTMIWSGTIIMLLFVMDTWNNRRPDGTLAVESKYLRIIAWGIIVLYFIAAPFGWLYMFYAGWNPVQLG